ncbi:pitrilysin family protein [Thermosynechococcaceae cyanobacterium BACA0444]|uniref:Pitrilysin family protein n=1 Tax=Pseudocalidococcus azoricus BACA0444 TaxID=2918990 RepID=A0AAE4FQI8_9CYAN|nr:pitrilysin family protein [Pseudocalidococcus azoricus]MDS3859672.1 pitrilysin family protein [Pseudocalidococcus azoricus BACA0444]
MPQISGRGKQIQQFFDVVFGAVVLGMLTWAWGLGIPVHGATLQPTTEPYVERAMHQVTEFSLKNGMRFIVMEQHQAPIISFLTYADVGGVDEPEGQTGVAHYLEHLAFKGTRKIGSQDFQQEAQYLDQLDHLFTQIQAAKQQQQTNQLKTLLDQFNQVQAQASKFVISNQYGQIVQQAGGVGLNATTSADATRYFYSFPANKLELWMSLESERFLEPVFRDFFTEKQVILEERRMRTENSATGQLFDTFLSTTFEQHPYRRPVIGYEADIANLTRQNVTDFFQQYYALGNLTMVLVGDVEPKQVKTLAEQYFGRYPQRPLPPKVTTVDPPLTAPRQAQIQLPSQPYYVEAYPCPPLKDRDYSLYELLTQVLTSGRTSRLYQALVLQAKIALNVQAFTGYPGNKYPNRLVIYALPAPGHSTKEVAQAIQTELSHLQTTPISDVELSRLQTQARMDLLQALMSTEGMAKQLAEYAVKTGDWRNLFQQLEIIEAVTPADIQRVAQALHPEQRTTVEVISEASVG